MAWAGVVSGMVAIEVMSPARPRSSSSARCTASSMASGDRNASGCSSEAGVVTMSSLQFRRSIGCGARTVPRSAERGRDLARCGERRHGAMRELRLFGRIIGAVMRAAAFASRPRGRCDQQRGGCHVAQRDIAGIPLDGSEGAHGLGEMLAIADHADMRGHHCAQPCFLLRRHRRNLRRSRACGQPARAREACCPRYLRRCARHRPRPRAASSRPAGWRHARRSTTLRRRPRVPSSEVRPCASTAMPPM